MRCARFLDWSGELEIGHIEAKDIGITLKGLEKKDQMKHYLNALGNLIFTDHLEFRWYVDGELRLSAAIATFDKQKKIKPDRAKHRGYWECEKYAKDKECENLHNWDGNSQHDGTSHS